MAIGWGKPTFNTGYSSAGEPPSWGDLSEGWDETYAGGIDTQIPFNTYFEQYLGSGVDVFDPESIASSLMEKYDVSDLTPGMFPKMSKDMLSGAQASTYDAYKRMMLSPEKRNYRKAVESTAGLLNPNKRRKRAMDMYRAGMSNINMDIFGRTQSSAEGIRNWMNNALRKVLRMKY